MLKLILNSFLAWIKENRAPVSRIILRYLSAILAGILLASEKEWQAVLMTPETVQAVGLGLVAVVSVAVEVAYVLAEKRGWKT